MEHFCLCAQLNDVEKTEKHQIFFGGLTQIEMGEWQKLVKCSVCSQLWAIDESDGRNTIFASKVFDQEIWQTANVEGQKQYLLRSRGGTSQEPCIKQGCCNNRLKGVMFCVHHFFELGWRE